MRWLVAEMGALCPQGGLLEIIRGWWMRLPRRQRMAAFRALALLICFGLGFVGAALLGPRQAPLAPWALRMTAGLLGIVAVAVLACLAQGEQAVDEALAGIRKRWASVRVMPRVDVASALSRACAAVSHMGPSARGPGRAVPRIDASNVLSRVRVAARRVGSSARELGRTMGDARGVAAIFLASSRANPASADCQATVSVVRRLAEPAPLMSFVAAPASRRAGGATNAATDLAIVRKALIEANNQSWRNQHLPVIAALSAASLARLRVQRGIRGRGNRLSLTAPPLIVLLEGGERPCLVADLARLLLPRDVGRALHLASLDGIDVARLARAGVSFVTLSAPRLVHEAYMDRPAIDAALALLGEAGIGVIGIDIDDSVVLAQLCALGVTLGEGWALSPGPQKPPVAEEAVPVAGSRLRARFAARTRVEPSPAADPVRKTASKASVG
jgi:hypothetical protein